MGRILIITSFLVLIFGGGLVLRTILTTDPTSTPIAGIGSGFVGDLPLSRAEINEVVSQANKTASIINNRGNLQQSIAHGLLLVTVFLGASSALLAGIQNSASWARKYATGFTITIGLLGSATAITTSTAGYLDNSSDIHFQCAATINTVAIEVLESVQAETNSLAARQYLKHLSDTADRCSK